MLVPLPEIGPFCCFCHKYLKTILKETKQAMVQVVCLQLYDFSYAKEIEREKINDVCHRLHEHTNNVRIATFI